MQVPIRELKNHLSEYLRRACAGERLTITSRGRALATLGPAVVPSSAASLVRELEAMPWMNPPRKAGKPAGAGHAVKVPEGTTEEIMDWVRGR